MSSLEEILHQKALSPARSIPQFFNLANEEERDALKLLIEGGSVEHVVDDYEEQERELFGVKNPTLVYTPTFAEQFEKHYKDLQNVTPTAHLGVWVFFPWKSTLTHILSEKDFFQVRTARNKNLINEEEQEKFYNAHIGIAGLSVGNSVALAIVLQGGGRYLKLADMDRLALSNINRIRTSVDNLGLLKVEMTARQIYEINPYAHIELFPEGVSKENITTFFDKLDIVIDEIDNLAVKYLLREEAQKNKIPVVMAADNGDNAVLDIDRFDLNPDTPFFHNRMGIIDYETLTKLDKFGIGKLITKLVGPENVTHRMQESLLEMGKTIVSWPQLGGAALLNGSAVAYAVRKILNGQNLESDRAIISLDEKLDPTYNEPDEIKSRTERAIKFASLFGL